MKKTTRYPVLPVLVAFILFFSGCATPTVQSAPTSTLLPEEPIPTRTPRPTDTPLPPPPTATATLTPVAYALTVQVLDVKSRPVRSASLTVAELGAKTDATLSVDAKGLVTWSNLPFGTASLTVRAPGYKTVQKSVILQPGPNGLVLKLQLDPYALLPEKACAPGEKLLYLADFQDNQAPGWPDIQAGSQGWSLGPDPAAPGNIVMIAQGSPESIPAGIDLSNFTFDNAVWRVSVKFDGGAKIFSFLNWRHSLADGDLRYFVNLGPGIFIDVTRFNSGESASMGRSGVQQVKDKWGRYEISTFNGTTEVWFGARRVVRFTDKAPVPPGTIGFKPFFQFDTGTFYFDNISVCGLSAPFKH
jgi:hypothetical protein